MDIMGFYMQLLKDNFWNIAIIIALCVVANLIPKKRKSKITDFKGSYKKVKLLTDNEKIAYPKIKEATERAGLILFAKVRLADIIKPKKDSQALFHKISQKHVDFLLCDILMNPVAVIEIDDSTHDREKGKARDAFVDYVLKDCGITTIRKRNPFTAMELTESIRAIKD